MQSLSNFHWLSFFTEIKKPDPQIHMELQRASNSQTILEKKYKFEGLKFPISKFTAKLQQSKQCGTGIKVDIQTNAIELRIQK